MRTRRSWSSLLPQTRDDVSFTGPSAVDIAKLVATFVASRSPSFAALKKTRDARTLVALDRAAALDVVAELLDRRLPSLCVVHACKLAKRNLTGKNSIQHFGSDVIGCSPAASRALRSAATHVVSKLVRIAATENRDPDVRYAALDALALDYMISPAADDAMLFSVGFPDAMESILRSATPNVVAAASRVIDKILNPRRPSTPLTRELASRAETVLGSAEITSCVQI